MADEREVTAGVRDRPRGRTRRLEVPGTEPRASHFQPPEPFVEVDLTQPGAPTVHAIAPEGDADEARAALVQELRDLPRLAVGADAGALDLRLEDGVGRVVKRGTVVLDGPQGPVRVTVDPVTRRFRHDGLAPGEYTVRATSGTDGRAASRLEVRPGEVTRRALQLDGRRPEGTSTVRLAIADPDLDSVRVRVQDSVTGALLRDDDFAVVQGVVEIDGLIPGWLHFDIEALGERACYDVDTDDDDHFRVPPIDVMLNPVFKRRPDPDPPPDWFTRLPQELHGLWPALHSLGIESLDQLALEEPEAVMHRALDAKVSLHSRAIARAIDAARVALAVPRTHEGVHLPLLLRSGATTSTAVRLDRPGSVSLDVDLGDGEGELLLEWPGGEKGVEVSGRRRVNVDVDKLEEPGELRIRIVNRTERELRGTVAAKLPVAKDTLRVEETTRAHLISIYSSLAERNPGLGRRLIDATLLPENLAAWVDHARAAMRSLGVCSIDDLGLLRMQPMQKLHPGAYVAPFRLLPVVPALDHYAFSHVIGGTILRYLPNDTLHETAIVLASEWDIRGQTVVIGSDVRELLVVVHSIRYDSATRITWEHGTLPPGPAYWPSPAPNGANGSGWGAHGAPGADGNQSPASSQNGGPNAVVEAPIVTMYLRDATGGLPPIELRGQAGGAGGRGQDGGRGGNGECGLRADGTFFGGCCRGVGWGGNGGAGGRGGGGGPGGNGGQGGRMTILTTSASIAAIDIQHPALDVNPGPGGFGGPPGSPGAGGSSGPAGSADCETWCSEHPERHGSNGAAGVAGATGPAGAPGPAPPSDALQFLPITEAQWDAQFNSPHVLSATPLVVEPGEHVSIIGDHFLPGTDRVFFDGVDVSPVASATSAGFNVPLDAEGGNHPAVIRNPGDAGRLSNKAMLQVIPKVTALAPAARWTEGTACTIDGLAFHPGCQVTAEDWSQTPNVLFNLPVDTVTRTAISLTIPPAPLGNLRGVRRIHVRNPDSGTSRGEFVARIGDTIVVRVAAFRLVGSATGTQTPRTAVEIADLFTEGPTHSIDVPWAAARIAFELAQPVADLSVPDEVANVFPMESGSPHATWDAIFGAAGFVPGALNILFARDVESLTAYAQFGGGPIVIGEEPGSTITATDLQQIVAHEVGHALCLRHICSGGEGPGTFFDRACEDSDDVFLMYPYWNESDDMTLDPGQVPIARRGASYVETGKTAPLAYASLFQATVPARCNTDDATS